MDLQDWVRLDSPLSQIDAEYLRDVIHADGYPARIEKITAPEQAIEQRAWYVLTRPEHAAQTQRIRYQHFDGHTRRPSKRWSVTALIKRKIPTS